MADSDDTSLLTLLCMGASLFGGGVLSVLVVDSESLWAIDQRAALGARARARTCSATNPCALVRLGRSRSVLARTQVASSKNQRRSSRRAAGARGSSPASRASKQTRPNIACATTRAFTVQERLRLRRTPTIRCLRRASICELAGAPRSCLAASRARLAREKERRGVPGAVRHA